MNQIISECETRMNKTLESFRKELTKIRGGSVSKGMFDDIMVEYAMLNDSSKLVVSKYQLYLPNIDQLKRRVKEIIEK